MEYLLDRCIYFPALIQKLSNIILKVSLPTLNLPPHLVSVLLAFNSFDLPPLKLRTFPYRPKVQFSVAGVMFSIESSLITGTQLPVFAFESCERVRCVGTFPKNWDGAFSPSGELAERGEGVGLRGDGEGGGR